MFSNSSLELQLLYKITSTQTILFHTLHETPEFNRWFSTCATTSHKSKLTSISKEIAHSLFTHVAVQKTKSTSFDYFYQCLPFPTDQARPTIEDCDAKLAEIYDLSLRLSHSIDACDMILSKYEEVSSLIRDHNIIMKSIKVNGLILNSNNWYKKIAYLNTCILNINSILESYYQFAHECNMPDIENSILNLTDEIYIFTTKKVSAILLRNNIDQLNRWTAIIDRIVMNNDSKYQIICDLEILHDNTDINNAMARIYDDLHDINNHFMLYLKSSITSQLSLFSQYKIPYNIPIEKYHLLKKSEKLDSHSFYKLAINIEDGINCTQNFALACKYYELAFIHKNSNKNKSLAFFHFLRLYYKAITQVDHTDRYQPIDLYLHQFANNIKNVLPNSLTVLNYIKCKIAKVQLDYLHGLISNDKPNEHLVDILYSLDLHMLNDNMQNNSSLEKTFRPIIELYLSNKLGNYNNEILEKILHQSSHISEYPHETAYRLA